MLTTLPGLIDAHVHLRTPGQTHKEDLSTGTRAALAGGFTHVLDMPNTTPPIVDRATLLDKLARVRERAHCDVATFLGGTEANAATVAKLAGHPLVVGLKLYLGRTHGPLYLPHLSSMVDHLRSWPGIVAVHAEGWHLAAAIGIARLFGRPLHCCHVSREVEIELIRRAKELGDRVTCEVTPHHLFLTEDDARRLGPLSDMRPTLGTTADRDALWANLEVIDCVASDHAPHTLEEKRGADPPPGVPGLETTLPLLLNAVHEGRLSLDRLVELLYGGPRGVYGLPRQSETTIEVDRSARHVLSGDTLYTKCRWTPFEGMPVRGRLVSVTLRGKGVYVNGKVRV
ncbi:MAG: amidohydrolase family protein [Anaerolineae bacterium]|nr:amidohydrolase family protein [Anaerolineae bacterium]